LILRWPIFSSMISISSKTMIFSFLGHFFSDFFVFRPLFFRFFGQKTKNPPSANHVVPPFEGVEREKSWVFDVFLIVLSVPTWVGLLADLTRGENFATSRACHAHVGHGKVLLLLSGSPVSP
jgi:NADH:ubiquinone oxidoreductase subunit 5 (subunit L)/multisubunit Na+/H+ antiporter MnhA subunit